MRITELFTAKSIALDVAAPDQAAIIDRLVELQATHGNITDKEAYKKALYAREAEGSTYVDNGITVPHAKTACVTRPSLAALRLSAPVQYNAEDDGTTDLLFAIAAPEDGGLHVDLLARMMQMLMNEDFVEKLRAAKTPAEFLDAIDAQEEAQFGDESFTQQQIPQNGYRVLAVTACPNGIAHTYMAAEALVKAGDKLGLPVKVETNGSDGTKNALTRKEIEACDGIIVAADKNVETARFDGKPVLFTRVDDGIHKPAELIQKVAHGEVPVFHAKGGVLMATGGFHANKDMVCKYMGGGVAWMPLRGSPYLMGENVELTRPFFPYYMNMDQFHGGPIHAQTQANPSTLVNYGVIVGTNGDRIINEAKTYVEMAKELPVITRNNLAYIVIDSAVLENDTVATRLDRYRAKKAPVYQADTYAELAKQMGVDPEVFTKTMEGYNEAVKSGKAAALTPGNTLKEPRLVVKAPFLALPFSGGMTATFGGPKINAKGQVLNAEQQPVPGLYAAGNAIGGLFYWNYIVGSQLTAAVIFGRHAAQDAAARAKAKGAKKA